MSKLFRPLLNEKWRPSSQCKGTFLKSRAHKFVCKSPPSTIKLHSNYNMGRVFRRQDFQSCLWRKSSWRCSHSLALKSQQSKTGGEELHPIPRQPPWLTLRISCHYEKNTSPQFAKRYKTIWSQDKAISNSSIFQIIINNYNRYNGDRTHLITLTLSQTYQYQ